MKLKESVSALILSGLILLSGTAKADKPVLALVIDDLAAQDFSAIYALTAPAA